MWKGLRSITNSKVGNLWWGTICFTTWWAQFEASNTFPVVKLPVMKCFKRLVKNHICSSVPATMDPLQFAYHENRSRDDALAMLSHIYLDKKNTYVRMLFIDYSSAFNSIVPAKHISKLKDLGLNTPLHNWIWEFLMSRPPSGENRWPHLLHTVSEHRSSVEMHSQPPPLPQHQQK